METKHLAKSVLLILALALSSGLASQEVAKDVILVLDNSGSMKKNDPGFLTSKAVAEFINNLEGDTRVAVLIFDKVVKFAVPLTAVDDASRGTILKSLEQIDYRGQLTDSPAAMERAIYDLKVNGRKDVEKSIIFMTDGIVDTGNKAIDAEKTRWLREDLAGDAGELGIRIFAVAFTDNADFLLIQSLARRTDGEYFRAMTPEDLPRAFAQINTIITTPRTPEPVPAPPPSPSPPPPAPAEDDSVMSAEDAAEFERVTGMSFEELENMPDGEAIITRPGEEVQAKDDVMALVILVGGALTLILLIVIIVMLVKRRGGKSEATEQQTDEDYVPLGYLNDINNITSEPSYELGAKPAMLGRVAGKDSDHLEYIVIAQSTIGRQHALIEYKDYSYWIIDQSSVNGTFVNGERISSETRLKHGDLVKLHKYEFEFAVPDLEDSGKTVFSETMDKTVIASAEALPEVAAAPIPEPEIDVAPAEPETALAENDDDFDFGADSGIEADEAVAEDASDADPAADADAPDLMPDDAVAASAFDDEEDDSTALFAEELPDVEPEEVDQPGEPADVDALFSEPVAEDDALASDDDVDEPQPDSDNEAVGAIAGTDAADGFDDFFSDDDAEALSEGDDDDDLMPDAALEEADPSDAAIPASTVPEAEESPAQDEIGAAETAIFVAAGTPAEEQPVDAATALPMDDSPAGTDTSEDEEIPATALIADEGSSLQGDELDDEEIPATALFTEEEGAPEPEKAQQEEIPATELFSEEESAADDEIATAETAVFTDNEAVPAEQAAAAPGEDSPAGDDVANAATAIFTAQASEDGVEADDAGDKTMLFTDDEEEAAAPAPDGLDDADAIEAKLAQAVAILDSGPEPEDDETPSGGFHERPTMMNEPGDDEDISVDSFFETDDVPASEALTREVPQPPSTPVPAAGQDESTVMVFADEDEGGPASADAFISTTVFDADDPKPISGSEAPTMAREPLPAAEDVSLDDFVDSGSFEADDSDATVLTLDEVDDEPPAPEDDDPDRTVMPDEVPDGIPAGGPAAVDQDDKTVFYEDDDTK